MLQLQVQKYTPDYSHVRSGGKLCYTQLSNDEQRLIDATILCRLYQALLDEKRDEFDSVARSDVRGMTGVMTEQVSVLRVQYTKDLQRKTPLLTTDWLEDKDRVLMRATSLCDSSAHTYP